MKTCNRKILELFYNAKHTGRISKPDAIGRVGDDNDGLVIELTWRVIGGIIIDAKFRAFGNPNAIAITSLMVENIIGKAVDEAIILSEDVIIDNLGEFRPEYLEVYDMVRECITDTYNNYLKHISRKVDEDVEVFDYESYLATHPMEDGQEIDIKQIQRELFGEVKTERRGRPRKVVDPSAVVEVGEKRGRGRPRKIVDETEIVEVGEKRGRGRPRKEVDPSAVVEVGEKRGRGRPRKIVDETEIVEVGEKRGRGRPRKEIDPNAVVEVGEKRGRGRPRKVVDPSAVVEAGEKRGRGRPRKIVDETEIVEVGEKRGRGRPKKEVKFNLPSDLDDVIGDEEVELLITGNSQPAVIEDGYKNNETALKSNEQPVNNLLDEDDEMFDADYDLFKSNIRNILSGKEVSEQNYTNLVKDDTNATIKENVVDVQSSNLDEEELEDSINSTDVEAEQKRGRGRPRKEVDPSIVVEEGEKRGRGRPRKIVVEEVEEEHEKRGRGRPRLQPINSLTRSLTPKGMMPHSNQEIVFASKNVTTTNININVTKTTTSVEDNKTTSDGYSHNTTISQQKVEVNTPYIANTSVQENEIDVDDELDVVENTEYELETSDSVENNLNNENNDDEYLEDEDFEDEVDTSNIKDEAPSGGIEDLLKALLDD